MRAEHVVVNLEPVGVAPLSWKTRTVFVEVALRIMSKPTHCGAAFQNRRAYCLSPLAVGADCRARRSHLQFVSYTILNPIEKKNLLRHQVTVSLIIRTGL